MAYVGLKYCAQVIQTVFWKFNSASAHYGKIALDTMQLGCTNIKIVLLFCLNKIKKRKQKLGKINLDFEIKVAMKRK